jgi:hypothetical protein
VSEAAWRSDNDVRGEPAAAVTIGDLIRTGENCHPQYQVIAVKNDRAWIRDVQSGVDHVVPIARCRKI